ncbi:MAG: hypothetical protein ACFE9S_07510 [Candidatus Hermodarchaeota archaeon]
MENRFSWSQMPNSLKRKACIKFLSHYYTKNFINKKLIAIKWDDLPINVQKILVKQGIKI